MVRHLRSWGFRFQHKFLPLRLRSYKLFICSFFFQGLNPAGFKECNTFHVFMIVTQMHVFTVVSTKVWNSDKVSIVSQEEWGDGYFWCLDVTRILDDRIVLFNIFALWFFIYSCRFKSLHWQGERQRAPLWFGIWIFSFKGLPKQHLIKVVRLGLTGQSKFLIGAPQTLNLNKGFLQPIWHVF